MSMRKIGMFMLILCTALLCCGSLFAATYYVDVDNGNNANDGLSQASAWKTIGNGEATNALSSGDTVKVLAGTYGPTALTNKSNGVTYLSEEGALIYAAEPNTTDNGFNLSGVSGATIKGFVFSGLHRGIYLENGSSDIRVTGNRFEDLHLQGGGEGCGVWVWSGSNVTIDHNIFKNVGTGPSEGCIVTG
ncbi:MAG: right-handed parallel beta-helix repeat-containing protein, partial [Abditibacteriota bacterium]|nr:right-handed parallel beta-helix repeat-containing protein [Abditibacteriota bacterium]